jgi:acetylornithine deacetylase/succinyl-diaminopimelate desuccinylase-like protein
VPVPTHRIDPVLRGARECRAAVRQRACVGRLAPAGGVWSAAGGIAALAECRRYILAELKAAGIAAREQTFDAMTPRGTIKMTNVIATIPAEGRPDHLASHYDTKLFSQFKFVGASDGASSTAAALELGRALKSRQNDYTIELLFPRWRGSGQHRIGATRITPTEAITT